MKRSLLILSLIVLTGCATYGGPNIIHTADGKTYRTTSLAEANHRVGESQPVAYRVGFMQGCDSGHASEGNTLYQNRKDEVRYGKDELYRQGWDTGYLQCKNDYIRAYRYPGYYSYGYYPYYYGPRYYFGFGHGFGPRFGPYYRGGFYYGGPYYPYYPYGYWGY
jgi:hypothetical protein